jgi:hypothetical protein
MVRPARHERAQDYLHSNLPRLLRVVGLVCCLTLTSLSSGCAFGPHVLEATHGRYNESVRSVYEEQLLRNIVHVRYNEVPAALNVSGIAAQYELSTQAEARPFFIAPNPSNSNVIFKTFTSILPDAVVSGSNRPTISLDPADDSAAIRQFLTPIPAETLVLLSRTNWRVETMLRVWVERLNGVPNGSTVSGPSCPVVSDFVRFKRIADLLQATQDRELARLRAEERFVQVGGPLPAAAITAAALVDAAKEGLEYRPQGDGKLWALVRPERRLVLEAAPGANQAPELLELEELLNLVPGQPQYELLVRSSPDPDPMFYRMPPSGTINVVLRSSAQVYHYLANGVELPAEHLKCGLAPEPMDAEGRLFDSREITRGLFEVHVATGHKPPRCAYVAVKYRGYWYYIDDQDQESKATFALMLQLTRLDFGRPLTARTGPVLTLPAGR